MARRAVQIRQFTPLIESTSGVRPTLAKGSDGGRVYKGVTIIKAGLGNRKDRRFYPPETLKEGVQTGVFKGLKAYADHPDAVSREIQPERSVRDYVGVYDKVRFSESGGGRVVGDLRVFKAHRWLSDTIDELLEIGQADGIGVSINGRGETTPTKLAQESGEPVDVERVDRFLAMASADIVTEAGAGGGFAELLEAAREDAAGESPMNERQKLLKALSEATAAKDLTKVGQITEQLTALEEVGAEKPASKAAKGREKPVAAGPAETADVEEDADAVADADDDEAAEDDPDADLNTAVEEAKCRRSCSDEDDEMDEAAEDDEDDEDVAEAGEHVCTCGARTAESDIARRVLYPPRDRGPLRKKKVSRARSGSMITTAKANKARGRTFGEADAEGAQYDESGEVLKLRRQLAETNRELSRFRRIDTARRIVSESGVDPALRGDLFKEIVDLPPAKARQRVEFAKGILESAKRMVRDEFEGSDEYGEIEGAGASLRESFGGFGSRGGEINARALVESVGLPLKKVKAEAR